MELHLNNNQNTLTFDAAYAAFVSIVRALEGRHNLATVFYGGSTNIQAVVGDVMVSVLQGSVPSTFATDFPNAINIGEFAPLRAFVSPN